MIPHSRPTVGKEEIEAAAKVIASGQLAQGREVEAFEAEFAHKIGVKHAAAVSSGTAALHLALMALGVSAGDDVIVPSYVCTALLNAVSYTGATPVLADADPDTLNIDPESAAERLTSNTKAIIVPHMFGLMADMAVLQTLGVPLIEDCAQSVGACNGLSMAGSIGHAGIFSFYATKMMTCGEGGMVVSNSEALIDRVRQNRAYDNRNQYAIRFNYKMTDIQAAMGRQQLRSLSDFIGRRREIAGLYRQAFSSLEIDLPPHDEEHVFYRYNIQVNQDVDWWLEQMEIAGIGCAKPVFKPLHHYNDSPPCPQTDRIFKRTLSVPIYPTLTQEQTAKIIRAVTEIYDRTRV